MVLIYDKAIPGSVRASGVLLLLELRINHLMKL